MTRENPKIPAGQVEAKVSPSNAAKKGSGWRPNSAESKLLLKLLDDPEWVSVINVEDRKPLEKWRKLNGDRVFHRPVTQRIQSLIKRYSGNLSEDETRTKRQALLEGIRRNQEERASDSEVYRLLTEFASHGEGDNRIEHAILIQHSLTPIKPLVAELLARGTCVQVYFANPVGTLNNPGHTLACADFFENLWYDLRLDEADTRSRLWVQPVSIDLNDSFRQLRLVRFDNTLIASSHYPDWHPRRHPETGKLVLNQWAVDSHSTKSSYIAVPTSELNGNWPPLLNNFCDAYQALSPDVDRDPMLERDPKLLNAPNMRGVLTPKAIQKLDTDSWFVFKEKKCLYYRARFVYESLKLAIDQLCKNQPNKEIASALLPRAKT